jgi:hypothetical protein
MGRAEYKVRGRRYRVPVPCHASVNLSKERLMKQAIGQVALVVRLM